MMQPWHQRFDIQFKDWVIHDPARLRTFIDQEKDLSYAIGYAEGRQEERLERAWMTSQGIKTEAGADLVDVIRQQEKTRILALIEEMMNHGLSAEHGALWNAALEALKNKINEN